MKFLLLVILFCKVNSESEWRNVAQTMTVGLKMIQTQIDQGEVNEAQGFINANPYKIHNEFATASDVRNVAIANWDATVNSIAIQYSLNSGEGLKIKTAMSLAKYMDKQLCVVQDFSFVRGSSGQHLVARLVTKNNGNSIDFAIAYYRLQFEFAPKKIKHCRKTGWWWGEKTKCWDVDQAISLSERNQVVLRTYYRHKAIKLFVIRFGTVLFSDIDMFNSIYGKDTARTLFHIKANTIEDLLKTIVN